MINFTKNNLVLFPTSREYYEQELMKYIDAEAYDEAMTLVKWLIDQPTLEQIQQKKLESLHEWLEQIVQNDRFENDNMIEKDFLIEKINHKAQEIQNYQEQLTRELFHGSQNQQLNALNQLAYYRPRDHSINSQIQSWIQNSEAHYFLQFKGLQTLKLREVCGDIEFEKHHERIKVKIELTPMDLSEFPPVTSQILERLNENVESDFPDVMIFAKQMITDFLIYHYGTLFYQSWTLMKESEVKIWVSALHVAICNMLSLHIEMDEAWDHYSISSHEEATWHKAHTYFCKFIQSPLK